MCGVVMVIDSRNWYLCSNIIETITEMKPILKDNGLLVVCEHDVWTDEFHTLI
jgi:hypothetical protein